MAAHHVVLTRTGGNREVRSMSSALGWGGMLTDPSAIPPYPGYGQTIAGVPVNAQSALQVPAVFTAMRIICFTIGKLGDPYPYRWKVDPASGARYRDMLPDSFPVLENTFGADAGLLLNYDGRTRTVASMALFSEAWWYTLEEDRNGLPLVLQPLNPLMLEIKQDSYATRPRYFYGLGKDRRELDATKLRHIPLLARPGDQRGMAPTQYLGVVLGLALASLEFGSAFFTQGASPSYLLSTEQNLNAAQIDQLATRFLVQHGGISQAHLPLILSGGLSAQKIQSTPDEAQFNQTLSAAYESIAAWFGVPMHLMGNTTERSQAYSAGATEEMMRQFETTCLSGYITALEESYSRLLPDGVFAAFNVSDLHKPDTAALAAEITALRQMQVASPNDIRVRKLHWPPSTDDAADQMIVPLASNTAPSQTEKPSAADADEKPPAKPAKAASRAEKRGQPKPPPNLRVSDSPETDQPEHECGTCVMWDQGLCWGYGNFPTDGEWVCDSWSLDPNWQQQDAAQDAADGELDTP